MATPVIMPRQGQSVESCIIAKWFKKKGDQVNVGDILFSYETDKASFDEEAKVSGVMLEIFANEGDDVPCLTNVCVIGTLGESVSEFAPEGSKPAGPVEQADSAAQLSTPAQVSAKADAEIPTIENDGDIKISPRARNLADKTGVDIRYAAGSGPYGRIIEKDVVELREKGIFATNAAKGILDGSNVEGTGLGGRVTTGDLTKAAVPGSEPALSATAPKALDTQQLVEEVKLTNIRKVIAKAMHHSISSTCQLTLNSSFDATDMMEFRKKLKDAKDRLVLENITFNDIIVYAVSRTLSNHKDLNAHFLDDKMLYFKNVNIGIAVDTERGLMVPTVMNANLKPLNEISAEIKSLVKECQKGTISPDLLKGGSFTITNLGTLDIESFTPVLNPPQTGILGVNNIIQRVREIDGEYEYYPAMGLSLTFDHRALDGAPAAKFLKDLKANLENFSVMLVK